MRINNSIFDSYVATSIATSVLSKNETRPLLTFVAIFLVKTIFVSVNNINTAFQAG